MSKRLQQNYKFYLNHWKGIQTLIKKKGQSAWKSGQVDAEVLLLQQLQREAESSVPVQTRQEDDCLYPGPVQLQPRWLHIPEQGLIVLGTDW